jgi:hypothetical protein|tara:strand:+ start:75 stop:755 length:681 start_codon:yes stop_codon:yes gene_type:complete
MEMRGMLQVGYEAFNGHVFTKSDCDQYNRIQAELNRWISANKEPPARRLDESHFVFNLIIGTYASDLNIAPCRSGALLCSLEKGIETMIYAVHVDNVGLVLKTEDHDHAEREARDWYEKAKTGEAGRADPHTFILDNHGELVAEYGGDTVLVDCEYTDTFGGEANYCWVRRETIEIDEKCSNLALVRRAKKSLGLNGLRGQMFNHGDMFEFRPYGESTVAFFTVRY